MASLSKCPRAASTAGGVAPGGVSSRCSPKSKQVDPAFPGTERIVLFALLRDGTPERWSRAELERDLYDVDPYAIWGSLLSLEAVGVVSLDGEAVQASQAARRIDALDMICV